VRNVLNLLWENSTDNFLFKELLECFIKICFGFVFYRGGPNLVVPLLRILKNCLEDIMVMVLPQEHYWQCGRYPRDQSDGFLEPFISTANTLLDHVFAGTIVIVFTDDAGQEDCFIFGVATTNHQ
jgi:hypothetical protein